MPQKYFTLTLNLHSLKAMCPRFGSPITSRSTSTDNPPPQKKIKLNDAYLQWYGQVKLNKKYHRAEFDIYQIYGVWE